MYCKLFGPRPDSQDVWILHSNWGPHKKIRNKHFKITLGMPGCDNTNCFGCFMNKVIVYLMNRIELKLIIIIAHKLEIIRKKMLQVLRSLFIEPVV